MAKIKVNRQEIEIKLGDYIYDNGACVMITSGDDRRMFSYIAQTMQGRKRTYLGYVVLPKKLVKKLAKVILWEKHKKKVIREIDLQIIDKLQE